MLNEDQFRVVKLPKAGPEEMKYKDPWQTISPGGRSKSLAKTTYEPGRGEYVENEVSDQLGTGLGRLNRERRAAAYERYRKYGSASQ